MNNLVFSDAISRIAPSPTVAMTQKARELRAAGRDVIALSVGEPDFDTPPHVAEAAIAAIRAGDTRYTAIDGTPALKAAIAAKFQRDNGLTYNDNEVAATPGGKFLIFAAFMATLNAGDEVIIPAPYWVSYPAIPQLMGAEAIIAPTTADDGFILKPDALEAAITPRTKWLVLNSPGNPTGAVYSHDDLAALAAVLRRHPHVWILSDDIYEHIVFDTPFATIAAVAPDLKDRTLIVHGASKAYAMTGWRLGFGAGPAPLITAMRKLASQSTTNPCSVSQAACRAALQGDHLFLDDWRSSYRRRRDLVVNSLNAIPGFECQTPQGAFYVYPSCAGLIGRRHEGQVLQTDLDVAEAILSAQAVATVPGTAFGMSPFLRLSYATDDASLTEALSRIGQFVEGLTD
ncbi:pyridoxal phosphate-dependent aminotransferase [Parvularcula sp. LCG005]|uniref:pyridoxal phosphate-dependent aminotransferase n=1 Tax=Parvularcula sp. LCG005 TaxID=3078805 RepID=UPI002943E45C|nr:pyridoxal phosphate-dependent aminotransferase [Parvularcula sp. LCG005]WOI52322.1 pyridoxal phosphate-dependent aminotransferase [Parvularcula sp. LCG005]